MAHRFAVVGEWQQSGKSLTIQSWPQAHGRASRSSARLATNGWLNSNSLKAEAEQSRPASFANGSEESV
jgi:hypothetical protein